MLQVIGTVAGAAAALVGAHANSNSSSHRRCFWVECLLVGRYAREGMAPERKIKKKATRAKQMAKGAKANTPWQSNRWTIQFNSKGVRDWGRRSRRPSRGPMVHLHRCSSTSSTITRRCSYLDAATGSTVLVLLLRCGVLWAKSGLKKKLKENEWYWSCEAWKRQACAHKNTWLEDRHVKGTTRHGRQIYGRWTTTAATPKEDYTASNRFQPQQHS